jgi:ubiquinone/menaquinone biosynthesis C-methylase UbiE
MSRHKTKLGEDWSLQNISDFWDWYSSKDYLQNNYFTSTASPGVVRFCKKNIKLKGRYLDFGCGSGQLLEQFSKETTLECYGADYSVESLSKVNDKLKNRKNWKGTTLIREYPFNFQSNTFDFISVIEAIEHFKEDDLDKILGELYRILKPGGALLVTTPFEENLAHNMIFCPFCNSEFHRMQHMRSFNVKSLSERISKNGFKVTYCDNLNFLDFNPLSFNLIKKRVKKIIGKIFFSMEVYSLIAKEYHLAAIAYK